VTRTATSRLHVRRPRPNYYATADINHSTYLASNRLHWHKLSTDFLRKYTQKKSSSLLQRTYISTLAYLLEYLVRQTVHREHPVRWHRGCLVSGNESAELADQFQAMVLHTSKKLGRPDDFLQAMATATHTHDTTGQQHISITALAYMSIYC